MTFPKRPEMETRPACLAASELRAEPAAEGKTAQIVGYAAVYDQLSEDLGGFREKIAPGAFTRSLKSGADVRALIDHVPSMILGRNKAGTLELSPNGKGLLVRITPPDTQFARDLMVSIERGDVSGMSFAFTVPPGGDDWEILPNGSGAIRTVKDSDLLDVSVVTYPAYPQTEVGLRSLQAYRELREQNPDADAGELRRMRMRLTLAEKS